MADHGWPLPAIAVPWLRQSLRAHIAKVFTVDSWPAFFELVNVPCPPKPAFVQTLLAAVENSARKGYHTRGTIAEAVALLEEAGFSITAA